MTIGLDLDVELSRINVLENSVAISVAGLQSQVNGLIAEATANVARIAAVETNQGSMLVNITTLQAAVNALTASQAKLQTDITGLQSTTSLLNVNLQSTQGDVTTLLNITTTLTTKLQAVDVKLQTAEANVVNLQTKQVEIVNILDSITTTINDVTTVVNNLVSAVNIINTRLTILESANTAPPVANTTNTAPTTNDHIITVQENGTYTFILSDFNYFDADGDPFVEIMIGTIPLKGTLLLANIVLSAAGLMVPTSAILNGDLVYLPVPNTSGTNYSSFAFHVSDGSLLSTFAHIHIDVIAAPSAPPPSSGNVNELEKISTNKISDVWPTNLSAAIFGNSGPKSILNAWNGGAWDHVNGKGYFFGGGHKDYGGNEVYEFDINSGLWTRLTDPDPDPENPTNGPPSAHTYDGVYFDNGLFHMWPSMYYTQNGEKWPASGTHWTFDPITLQWNKLPDAPVPENHFLRSAKLPNGNVFIGTNNFDGEFNPTNNTWTQWAHRPNYGAGNSVSDPFGVVYTVQSQAVLKQSAGSGDPIVISGMPAGINQDSGISYFDNKVIIWAGFDYVIIYDTVANVWSTEQLTIPNGAPDGSGRVISKFTFKASTERFIGVDASGDVWSFKLSFTGGTPPPPVSTQLIEDVITNLTKNGETIITVPPGIYHGQDPFTIASDLDINFTGVTLLDDIWGKARLIIPGPHSIIIRNLNVDGGLSMVRGEFNSIITLINCHGRELSEGIILSSNDGGSFNLIDCSAQTLNNLDSSQGFGQRHLIYIGVSDFLRMERCKHLGMSSGGHLVKSRAKRTEIIDCEIDGLNTNHSRVIDCPESNSSLLIRNSTLRGSQFSDNSDILSIAVEGLDDPSIINQVDIENSTISYNRGDGQGRLLTERGTTTLNIDVNTVLFNL